MPLQKCEYVCWLWLGEKQPFLSSTFRFSIGQRTFLYVFKGTYWKNEFSYSVPMYLYHVYVYAKYVIFYLVL